MSAGTLSGRSGGAFEVAGVTVLAWLLLACIPWGLGGIGLSWDALNHHIYLGWMAEQPRFDRDFLAASYQSYQYPYLYWPAYKLFMAGVSGAVAGTVLVSLHVLAVPALWMIARICVPGAGGYAVIMRVAAVLLGLSGELLLSLMDTTANDGVAAVPFVWAVALALWAAARPPTGRLPVIGWVALSGLFAGVAVAFKLSNGPLALALPLLWATSGRGTAERAFNVVRGGAATIFGFVLAYGYWGTQLWMHFGNPLYPFYDGLFAGLRAAVGWQP